VLSDPGRTPTEELAQSGGARADRDRRGYLDPADTVRVQNDATKRLQTVFSPWKEKDILRHTFFGQPNAPLENPHDRAGGSSNGYRLARLEGEIK
jgi:hypothetical protein